MDVCVTIYPNDDQYIENDEQLVVTIESDRARLMGAQEAVVTILDNDGVWLCDHVCTFVTSVCVVCVCVCFRVRMCGWVGRWVGIPMYVGVD